MNIIFCVVSMVIGVCIGFCICLVALCGKVKGTLYLDKDGENHETFYLEINRSALNSRLGIFNIKKINSKKLQ